MDVSAIESILPHRYPFLFLDRVLEVEPNRRVHARKLVSISDPILQGHFPGLPIMPGVVLVETMAQAAIVLSRASGMFDPEKEICYFLSIKDAKFRALVQPGDALDVHVTMERGGRIGKFSGEIKVDGEVRASASFVAVVEPRKQDD
ncbi:MAG: 3-hydroxyacyl-ACP dehydratase FabZ [Myxococcales bacterium FL481]|nr:MAG: 3-hydroxyacyl-ACP dehydratase FabZ [Myxococcales bacterium FL481]